MSTISYRTDRAIDVAAFKDILERSGLAARRPVGEPERLAKMLRAYNLVVTAWADALLVGVATLWTDYAFTAYLADLAVDQSWQKRGVGRRLVELSRETVGPEVTLLLLAAPAAADYYPKIGMERFTDCFLLRRSR
jgi:predicted N-acetyltransferase YhbS